MTTPALKGVHHLAVVVADLPRAERFYVKLLGLPVLKRWCDAAGKPRSLWVKIRGREFLALELAHRARPQRHPEAPGWHCVAFKIDVDDRRLWRRRLQAAGIPLVRESDYTLYVLDPDGNLVGLSHYPKRSPQGGAGIARGHRR